MQDEQAIHQFFELWRAATMTGDVEQIQSLCADDAIFLQPGQAPIQGGALFAAAFRGFASRFRVDYKVVVEDIRLMGDHACVWTSLTVTAAPRSGGEPQQRAGNSLTLLERRDGKWVLSRDANMLVAVPQV